MKNYLYLAAISCVFLSGCSSSSTSESTEGTEVFGSSADDAVLTGIFIDSAVEGLSYATGSQAGVTNELGEFQYLAGESVTFSIGELTFPTVIAKETVTPLDMIESTDINDNLIVNTTVLLQSLDVDANPSNGISISDQVVASATSIDLTVDPSEFSQNSAVINLIANAGSVNTSLISAEDASQHFQSTLVSTGVLEAFSRLDYTNLLIGNTADFSEGSKIYYREDGAKFALRLSGDQFEGAWWLDENGLLCEDIPSSQTTYCVADAENFSFNKSPESENSYNYSEIGFVSGLTISAGDTLGLSGTGSAGSHSIVGTWDITYAEGCTEKYTFNADGTTISVDLEEIQTGTYVLSSEPIDNNRYSIELTVLTDNQLPGCDGETESSANRVFSFFVEIESDVIRFYSSVDAVDTIFQMTLSEEEIFSKSRGLVQMTTEELESTLDGNTVVWVDGSIVYYKGSEIFSPDDNVTMGTINFSNNLHCRSWNGGSDKCSSVYDGGDGILYFFVNGKRDSSGGSVEVFIGNTEGF